MLDILVFMPNATDLILKSPKKISHLFYHLELSELDAFSKEYLPTQARAHYLNQSKFLFMPAVPNEQIYGFSDPQYRAGKRSAQPSRSLLAPPVCTQNYVTSMATVFQIMIC
jgi:hypothetical protein